MSIYTPMIRQKRRKRKNKKAAMCKYQAEKKTKKLERYKGKPAPSHTVYHPSLIALRNESTRALWRQCLRPFALLLPLLVSQFCQGPRIPEEASPRTTRVSQPCSDVLQGRKIERAQPQRQTKRKGRELRPAEETDRRRYLRRAEGRRIELAVGTLQTFVRTWFFHTRVER